MAVKETFLSFRSLHFVDKHLGNYINFYMEFNHSSPANSILLKVKKDAQRGSQTHSLDGKQILREQNNQWIVIFSMHTETHSWMCCLYYVRIQHSQYNVLFIISSCYAASESSAKIITLDADYFLSNSTYSFVAAPPFGAGRTLIEIVAGICESRFNCKQKKRPWAIVKYTWKKIYWNEFMLVVYLNLQG